MKELMYYIICNVIILIFVLTAPSFAEIEKIGFENKHTARIATSGSDDSFYITRAQALVNYNFLRLEQIVKIAPFFELQHNLQTNNWWRKEVGAEIGTSFFNDIFYYGASFQHIWQQQENYSVELMEETTEWESRLVITPSIPWGIFKDRLKLHLFEEYTYDFTRGQATFNEVGVILDWQIHNWLRLPIGWRHVDRVHDFDADLIELSVLFSF